MPQHKTREDFLNFKINILTASISSLICSGQAVTDLMMEKNKLREELDIILTTKHNKYDD